VDEIAKLCADLAMPDRPSRRPGARLPKRVRTAEDYAVKKKDLLVGMAIERAREEGVRQCNNWHRCAMKAAPALSVVNILVANSRFPFATFPEP